MEMRTFEREVEVGLLQKEWSQPLRQERRSQEISIGEADWHLLLDLQVFYHEKDIQ